MHVSNNEGKREKAVATPIAAAFSCLVDRDCQRCGLAGTRRQVVQPEVAAGLRLLFLGRDPGEVEDREGTPLHPAAPAGRLLRQLVSAVGIPPVIVGYDNVVHCHTPKNRGPRAAEVLACRVWRRQVVAAVHPEVVCLLGQEALEAYTNPEGYRPKKPKHALADWHGREVLPGVWSAYHPSAALRNTAARRALMGDLRVVAAQLGVAYPRPRYRMALPHEWPPKGALVAVDTETGRDGGLLGYALAWRTGGISVARWGVAAPPVLVFSQWELVFHNFKFDFAVLSQAGTTLPFAHDTMLMAHVLRRDQEVGSLGLKELAAADLGLSWPTMEELGHPEDMDPETRADYCCDDAVATLFLAEKYLEMLG